MKRCDEILLQGPIIYGNDCKCLEGYICIDDGIIKEVGQDKVDADFMGIIAPCFVNAHVHVGDSVCKDPPFLPLSDLVGPGGLKADWLCRTPRELIVEGMRKSLLQMAATGTYAFADFREGGRKGVQMLQEALNDLPLLARIFGRPAEGENEIHKDAWGLGISSTRDHKLDLLRAAISAARKAGQAVAVHAGEAGNDDIDDALDLHPDFLVHMNRATKFDLKKVALAGVPVVVCPRSNLVTDAGMPDVKSMAELGILLAVGTDNVMLNSPNMFDEMHLLSKALLHDDRQVFKMCTLNGARVLGIDRKLGSIEEGKEARVMVMDGRSNNLWGSLNPLASVVRRADPSDILAIF